jgi:adenylosuccinate lyase
MEAVKRGGDRQVLHEVIRRCSMESVKEMRAGKPCDLISRLAAAGTFGMTEQELSALLVPRNYTGRCAEQVEQLLETYRTQYEVLPERDEEISV